MLKLWMNPLRPTEENLAVADGEIDRLQDEIASLKQQLADAQKDADNMADIATLAMRKAWQLGQTYWQQADSDSYSQNAKSDLTQQKFLQLCDETHAAISSQKEESPPPKNCATCVHGDADFNRQVPCGNCDPNTLSEWKQKGEAMPTNTVFTVTEEDVDSAIKAVRNSL